MKNALFFIAFVASVLLSCQKNKELTLPKDTVVPIDSLTSIILSDTLNIYIGTTRQLPLSLKPFDYHLDLLKFKSSDTTVVAVSASGLISAKKVGTSSISISNLTGNITASTLVTVLPTPLKDRIKSITLSDTLNIYAGKTRQLSIMLSPSNYHLDSLRFTSSDSTVLTISTTGLMSAKKVGQSTISVSNLTNTVSANSAVTVLPVPVYGLIAYYPFNNSAADLSGNGNNGTATRVVATQDRFYNADAAYYFNNVGADSSWVTVKDNPALRLSGTDFTINVWINISTYKSNSKSIIIDKRGHVSPACWALGISSGNIPFFATSDNNTPILSGTTAVDTAKWCMITTVYTEANHTTSLYINGVLNNSATNIPMPGANNYADIYIGKDNPVDFGGFYFQGEINDIRIYNIAITTQQIVNLYSAPN